MTRSEPMKQQQRTGGGHLAWLLLVLTTAGHAQDLEPRRWSHLPLGTDFAGLGYAYSEGDIAFDPVLRIEDGTVEMHSMGAKYIHSFSLLDKSARFDLLQTFQSGSWSGVLNGVPTAVERSGWADTTLRFAVNLYGAPPLSGKEFAEYRAAHADCETIVGAGLAVVLPTGEYFDDKLINLGGNRCVARPQLGIVHSRGKWTMELTGAASFYDANDDFWNGNRLEQDPLGSLESHLIYTVRPGWWLGGSAGYDFGGRSSINGAEKNDRRNQLSWALTVGAAITPQVGLKLSYLGTRTQEKVGTNLDTIAVAISVLW
ncbi:MAG: transporter [Verrucomicrobia bacterium]|nr:transporter [Verrucomicrobiota bacterium]